MTTPTKQEKRVLPDAVPHPKFIEHIAKVYMGVYNAEGFHAAKGYAERAVHTKVEQDLLTKAVAGLMQKQGPTPPTRR